MMVMYFIDCGIEEFEEWCGDEYVFFVWVFEWLCEFVDFNFEFEMLVEWFVIWLVCFDDDEDE